jgi:hypothetical protein
MTAIGGLFGDGYDEKATLLITESESVDMQIGERWRGVYTKLHRSMPSIEQVQYRSISQCTAPEGYLGEERCAQTSAPPKSLLKKFRQQAVFEAIQTQRGTQRLNEIPATKIIHIPTKAKSFRLPAIPI